MTPSHCEHVNRIKALVDLDFSRQETPDGPRYSSTVAFGICKDCGHIQLDAKNHRDLCEWLKMNKLEM